MNSAWDTTKKRSKYHFDHTYFDPDQDRVVRLGFIKPSWDKELADIVENSQAATWRTRGAVGKSRPEAELAAEDYDLEREGYGADYVITNLNWEIPPVLQAIADRFAAAMAQRAKGLTVGSGLDAATQMGPLANPRRPQAMESLIGDALAQGATLLAGGERVGSTGNFWAPTLLADVPLHARLMNEEPFGPVALIHRVSTMEDAIAEANRLPFGLAAYLFTENARTANLMADAVESGMVGINTMAMSAADSPFGGVKDSGHGSEDGPEGMRAFQVIKAIHQH